MLNKKKQKKTPRLILSDTANLSEISPVLWCERHQLEANFKTMFIIIILITATTKRAIECGEIENLMQSEAV